MKDIHSTAILCHLSTLSLSTARMPVKQGALIEGLVASERARSHVNQAASKGDRPPLGSHVKQAAPSEAHWTPEAGYHVKRAASESHKPPTSLHVKQEVPKEDLPSMSSHVKQVASEVYQTPKAGYHNEVSSI